jgi:hypothetical protein
LSAGTIPHPCYSDPPPPNHIHELNHRSSRNAAKTSHARHEKSLLARKIAPLPPRSLLRTVRTYMHTMADTRLIRRGLSRRHTAQEKTENEISIAVWRLSAAFCVCGSEKMLSSFYFAVKGCCCCCCCCCCNRRSRTGQYNSPLGR